jgi:hypothetical protein
VFRELSLAYGWTPAEIEALTAEQLARYCLKEATEDARWIAPDEARQRAKARRAARDGWTCEVMEILNRGVSTSSRLDAGKLAAP